MLPEWRSLLVQRRFGRRGVWCTYRLLDPCGLGGGLGGEGGNKPGSMQTYDLSGNNHDDADCDDGCELALVSDSLALNGGEESPKPMFVTSMLDVGLSVRVLCLSTPWCSPLWSREPLLPSRFAWKSRLRRRVC
jgi:hypothetical protein